MLFFLQIIGAAFLGLIVLSYIAGFLLKPFQLLSQILKKVFLTLNAPISVAHNATAQSSEAADQTVSSLTVLDSEAEPTVVPPFQCADIHWRKIKGGGRLVLYVYPNIIRRSVWVNKTENVIKKEQRRLVREKGNGFMPISQHRYTLPDLEPSNMTLDQIFKQSIIEIESLIYRKNKTSRRGKISPAIREKISPAMVMPPVPVVSKVVADPKVEVAVPAAISSAEITAIKAPEETAIENPIPEPETLHNLPKGNPVDVWEGIVKNYGMKKRQFGKEPPFTDFHVIIHTDSGIEKEVWGVDLNRAIEESGAKLGDRIRVQFMGKQLVTIPDPKVDGGEITTKKKFFSVALA